MCADTAQVLGFTSVMAGFPYAIVMKKAPPGTCPQVPKRIKMRAK
jgi:hypothetical protein